MDRKQFIAEMAVITGMAAVDGFGLLKVSSALQLDVQTQVAEPSKDIKDYPHITDIIPSKNLETHFPVVVSACSDPKMNYLTEIPFLIELEVCKMWKESLFEWDALSNYGAAGLQQLMETTARAELGLTIVISPELEELNTAISKYSQLQKDVAAKRQALYKEVESGTGDITKDSLITINKLRSELADLEAKRESAYKKLKSAKEAYKAKIQGMSMDKLRELDSRFVPELAVPAGVKHIVKDIMECKKSFGGPVEMNVWRGVAAYNSGLQRTKDWNGLPFIRETVLFTRDILYNLTKMLELKYAYLTKDSDLVTRTKQRLGL